MEILYHYCSTAAFHAIAQSHSVWLSSLSLTKDTTEGNIVANAITRLAGKESLDQQSVQKLQKAIEVFEEIFDGLGFCLSEDGDLLSQWRGYAANATGIAIGFSAEYLTEFSKESLGRDAPGFSLQKAEYEPSAHETRVEPTYREVRKLIDDGVFRSPSILGLAINPKYKDPEQANTAASQARVKLPSTLLSLFPELYRLKAYAFREEREWRLISHLIKAGEDRCSHRVVHDRIVPYREIKFTGLQSKPIVEVILGPKHATPPKLVENFLKQNQYGVVRVRRSEASYR